MDEEPAAGTVNGLRQPQQRRSRDSLERVYGACNALLQEKTFDAITIAEISAQSEVTVGSIYQRFGSKDGLLWALYQHYLDDVQRRVLDLEQRLPERNSLERARAVLILAVSLFREHRGTVRSLSIRYQQSPQSVPQALSERIELLTTRIVRLLASESSKTADRADQEFRYSLAIAACRDHILFRSFRALDSDVKDDDFIDRLLLAVFHPAKD